MPEAEPNSPQSAKPKRRPPRWEGGHGEQLSRRRELAIAALLEQITVKDAAKQCKINEWTLRRWLKNPDFIREYKAARARYLEQAITFLARSMLPSASHLHSVVGDETAMPEHRINAARTILQLAVRAIVPERVDLTVQRAVKLIEGVAESDV